LTFRVGVPRVCAPLPFSVWMKPQFGSPPLARCHVDIRSFFLSLRGLDVLMFLFAPAVRFNASADPTVRLNVPSALGVRFPWRQLCDFSSYPFSDVASSPVSPPHSCWFSRFLDLTRSRRLQTYNLSFRESGLLSKQHPFFVIPPCAPLLL